MAIAAALLAALLAACRAAPDPFYLGGIQVNEPDLDHWLDGLESAGMNTVSVTDYAHQGDWDSWNLWWDDDDEGILREIRRAKERRLHVVLILRVALDHAFARNAFLWHGMIQPRSDADLDEWFDRYRRFATRWAERAEHLGVDVLMLASEMSSLTSTEPVADIPELPAYYLDRAQQAARIAALEAHADVLDRRHLALPQRGSFASLDRYLDARVAAERDWAREVTYLGEGARLPRINARRARLDGEWRRLIARLRRIYHGRLGYAANFDQYEAVGFWDALDVIGINAYFELRQTPLQDGDRDALYAALLDGWRGVLGRIATFRRSRGLDELPVIFTELGYTDRAQSTLRPWAGEGFALVGSDGGDAGKLLIWEDQPRFPEERALAVRALYQAHSELTRGFLRGLLYWKLSTQERFRGVEPFVLIVGPWSDDPLIDALQTFASGDGTAPPVRRRPATR